jgi:hypothetical protein
MFLLLFTIPSPTSLTFVVHTDGLDLYSKIKHYSSLGGIIPLSDFNVGIAIHQTPIHDLIAIHQTRIHDLIAIHQTPIHDLIEDELCMHEMDLKDLGL